MELVAISITSILAGLTFFCVWLTLELRKVEQSNEKLLHITKDSKNLSITFLIGTIISLIVSVYLKS